MKIKEKAAPAYSKENPPKIEHTKPRMWKQTLALFHAIHERRKKRLGVSSMNLTETFHAIALKIDRDKIDL